MPLYEYRCSACHQSSEMLEKVSDTPATLCPHCNKNALERQVSASRFQLKGTGWYVTDFKDKNKKPIGVESKSEDKPSSTDSESSDKPAPPTTDTPKKDTDA